MIQVRNLKKSFGSSVIFKDVSFDINKGDSVVIIGGSGCGKSTLLRCINRLFEPDCGEIIFNGKNILDDDVDINKYRQKVGMVYQHFNLFSHLNVLENCILTPVKVLHMPQDEAIEKAKKLLDLVGMSKSLYKMPSSLSGGQKQRVSIARTLMMDPELVLFDEPTSALDPTMVDEVENVIKDLISKGLTCVIVTHEMRFAKSVASKVIFLAEKGIYETGTAEEIFDRPDKPLTRQFIYRSRLSTIEINKNTFDVYDTLSKIKSILMPYGLTKSQSDYYSIVVEELIAPILANKDINNISLNIVGSETGIGHKMFIETLDVNENLLDRPEIDELGKRLITKQGIKVMDTINEDNHHVLLVEK